MPLFEVAIISRPTKKQEEEGITDGLVLAPTAVVANDAQSAAIKATQKNPIPESVDLNRCQVLVRPFA